MEESGAADAGAPAATERRRALQGAYRGGFGVALIVGAALLFLYANGLLAGLGDLALTVLVVVAAVGLILAPFWWRLVRSLTAERAARIRSQERTEVSAHLHDSVLQTLALVQRQAGDPRAVSALARRQERELRMWLQDRDTPGADESLAGALAAAAEEVEAAHGVGVDIVTVGDASLDDHTRALTAAAREALVNAAKFAGDDGPVSLYVEADGERLQVFVRDRGPGFDPDAAPADRRGVRDSIVGRMARNGGRATIRPAPGRGTEVELTMERPR
jgi:signal transduction histidine kinase